MRPPDPDPLPLRVDVINGWPLFVEVHRIDIIFVDSIHPKNHSLDDSTVPTASNDLQNSFRNVFALQANNVKRPTIRGGLTITTLFMALRHCLAAYSVPVPSLKKGGGRH